jgi:hypothetical protein
VVREHVVIDDLQGFFCCWKWWELLALSGPDGSWRFAGSGLVPDGWLCVDCLTAVGEVGCFGGGGRKNGRGSDFFLEGMKNGEDRAQGDESGQGNGGAAAMKMEVQESGRAAGGERVPKKVLLVFMMGGNGCSNSNHVY